VNVLTDRDDLHSSDGIYYRATNSSMGFAANGAIEIAIAPCMNIGFGAGYQMYSASNSWDLSSKTGENGSWSSGTTINDDITLSHTGLTAQVYLTWSPPALPFDPIDMIRGMSGL
jgi:hypothetical protein